jgi:hypothetical protein
MFRLEFSPFFLWYSNPTRDLAASLLRLLAHTHTHRQRDWLTNGHPVGLLWKSDSWSQKTVLWLYNNSILIILRNSTIGIMTRYELDGAVIEPRGGENFRTRPDRPWGPPSLLYNGYRVYPGDKAAGAWRWPPTPSSDEVKEIVQLYLYSPSRPTWHVIGWPLPLTLSFTYIYSSTLYPVQPEDGLIRTERYKTNHIKFINCSPDP